MFFYIRTTDKPGQPELRQRLETEHRAWLSAKAGAIVAAGAVLNDDGSDKGGGVYLIEAADRDAAEAFIHEDPFFKAGLFAHVEVERWRKAYVEGEELPGERVVTATPYVDPEIQRLLDTVLAPKPGAHGFDVAAARAGAAKLSRDLGGEPMVVGRVREQMIPTAAGDVRVRIYDPARVPRPGATIVYLHGGGWVTGDLDGFDPTCRALCAGSGATVVSVDYRHSPEVRFSGPLDDCLVAARWALANAETLGGDPAKVAIAGDSVGGGMAAVVTRRLVAEGRKPALQVLLYPATDATMAEASYGAFGGGGFYVSQATMEAYYSAYLGPLHDRRDPDVSALFAADEDLKGLPPAILLVAGCDPLRDEGLAYADRLTAAGVPVDRIDVAGAIHAFFRFRVATIARTATADVALRIATALNTPRHAGTAAVVSMVRPKPGMEQAVRDICTALGDLSVAEANCVSYAFHRATEDRGLFVFYEAFRTQADLQAHLDAPHTQAWFERMKVELDGAPQITRLEVITSPDVVPNHAIREARA